MTEAMVETNGVTNITDMDFTQVTGDGVSLVDFWAPWCQPCRIQGPILDKVADQIGKDARICKMNVDENREAPRKFGITGIPTLLLFKNGEMVKQFVGVQQEDVLVAALKNHM